MGAMPANSGRPQAASIEEVTMSKSAAFVRHKAKPGKRDEVRRIWEKYARDYVAGSNHTLPTDGAARFASGLSARHFRRRMAEVRVGPAAASLARAGAPIARAEGFEQHAASMEIRDNPASR